MNACKGVLQQLSWTDGAITTVGHRGNAQEYKLERSAGSLFSLGILKSGVEVVSKVAKNLSAAESKYLNSNTNSATMTPDPSEVFAHLSADAVSPVKWK